VRILFVVPYVPSLVRVRPYNLIRYLAARGHRITLATVWTNEPEREELKELEAYCAEIRAVQLPPWRSAINCLRALATGEPLQARYSWSAALQRHVTELSAAADVVHVEHLRGAVYGLPSARPPQGPPVVWDSVDCISHLFEQAVQGRQDRLGRLINRLELSRTRRCEGRLVTQFERVVVTSGVDRAALLNLAGGRHEEWAGRVTVLPNGVDLDYFTPGEGPRDADTLVFSGKMSYHANESAVLHLIHEVMPRVWARRPATRLVVVGKDPSGRLRGVLAGHGERITITGTVPDIRPYLRRAAVAVVPLVYGAGCQNKVLEAMACATPVVATAPAISALTAEPGTDVLVAQRGEAFADAVLDLLGDARRQREVGESGRRYVEAQHHWGRVANRLEGVYHGVVKGPGEAPAPTVVRRQVSRLTELQVP
jgi:polysaccharide biosynthesis protein PslH